MQTSGEAELHASADLARRDTRNGAVSDGAQPLAVEVSSEGETLRLHVSGEIDLANSGEFASALSPASMTSVRRVIVDLNDVTFLDSTSLHALIDTRATLDRYGIGLRVTASPGSPAHRLLLLTGLSDRFGLAVAALERRRRDRRIHQVVGAVGSAGPTRQEHD